MPSLTLRSSDLCRLAGFWELVRLKVENLSTRCCIVGAGPCGLMVGLLLTRAGVDVIVLEKHALMPQPTMNYSGMACLPSGSRM